MESVSSELAHPFKPTRQGSHGPVSTCIHARKQSIIDDSVIDGAVLCATSFDISHRFFGILVFREFTLQLGRFNLEPREIDKAWRVNLINRWAMISLSEPAATHGLNSSALRVLSSSKFHKRTLFKTLRPTGSNLNSRPATIT